MKQQNKGEPLWQKQTKDWVTFISKQKFAKALEEAQKRNKTNAKMYCIVNTKGEVSFDTTYRSNGGSKFCPATICDVDSFHKEYMRSVERVNDAIHAHNESL